MRVEGRNYYSTVDYNAHITEGPDEKVLHVDVKFDVDCLRGRITDVGGFYTALTKRMLNAMDETLKEYNPKALLDDF